MPKSKGVHLASDPGLVQDWSTMSRNAGVKVNLRSKPVRRASRGGARVAEIPAPISSARLTKFRKLEADILAGKVKGRPVEELLTRLARRA
jgi:hypothetical protein